ncbi:unnamed protein product (macronuclear) [Paramecium tetraurelia]|uniref:Protein kinase domain-containing protein n=1 Tax=Paramecium tetraurelia TaxID=5888 RepID=A0BKC9_PARTE|nr:uncharacterized protein GSPATT00029627001 [Paramecium tetraurelia]CAK58996.1 unnamed protein product [Paramecium tetraurelia]|eukprot:XP_001426394.1 hypothetical protein (macronuclear) [Paramecium tetraurelia strain d4-2]
MINVAQFKPNQFSIQFKHPYQQAIQFAQLQFETITIDAKTFRKFKPPLGEGSEGIVSKGQNVQTNENVAIKEYKSINKNELQAIQAIQRYKFKNIIGIIGVQERQNGLPVVVMEFAHGEFYQYMQTPQYQNLSYEEKNLCFIQMMEGLEQLHQLGLFHRDVKPENFVYVKGPTNEITIKLIDFGLVKENKENMFQTSKVGTPYYMAPEVFGNQNNSYDKSVDIWSLGAIWYELLTNDTFFQGNRQEEIFYKIVNISQEEINRQIQQNDSIKEKEKHFIKSMLQKVPSQRIQLKEVIQFYLNQFVTDLESFIKELQKKKREGLSEKLQNQQIKIRNELNQFKQISLDNVKKANQTEFKRKLKQFKEIERIEEKEVIKMQFYNQKEEEQKKIENLIYEKLLINDSQINQKIFKNQMIFQKKWKKKWMKQKRSLKNI